MNENFEMLKVQVFQHKQHATTTVTTTTTTTAATTTTTTAATREEGVRCWEPGTNEA